MSFSLSSFPWHTRVRTAIEQGDDVTLNTLLAPPETRIRVLGGFMLFGGGSSKVSFAEMCHRVGQLNRLEQVIDSAPGGVTFDDVCSVYDIDESGERPILMSYRSSWPMAEDAVRKRDKQLLGIVLRAAPRHLSLQTASARLAGMTVHEHTLFRAMQASDAEAAADLFEMARALHASGAPVGSETYGLTDLIADTVWSEVAAKHAERHLHELIDAGSVDINALLDSGPTPLQLAAQAGNGHGAAALMRAGCTMDMPGTTFDNIISYAQGVTEIMNPNMSAKTIALVTEAYMTRRLQGAPVRAAAPPPPARRARAV